MEKIGEETYAKRIELAKKITYSVKEILDGQPMPDALAAIGLGIGVNIKEFEAMAEGKVSAEELAEAVKELISKTILMLKIDTVGDGFEDDSDDDSEDTTENIKPEAEA